MNTSRPPGRSSRAACGIQRYGSHQTAAPYSLITRSAHPSRNGTRSASACSSGNARSNSACIARAVASCRVEVSTPTGRAPRRASHADT